MACESRWKKCYSEIVDSCCALYKSLNFVCQPNYSSLIDFNLVWPIYAETILNCAAQFKCTIFSRRKSNDNDDNVEKKTLSFEFNDSCFLLLSFLLQFVHLEEDVPSSIHFWIYSRSLWSRTILSLRLNFVCTDLLVNQ